MIRLRTKSAKREQIPDLTHMGDPGEPKGLCGTPRNGKPYRPDLSIPEDVSCVVCVDIWRERRTR